MQTALLIPRDSFWRRHPLLVDSIVMALLLALFYMFSAGVWGLDLTIVHMLVGLGMLLPYMFRRKWPIQAAAVVVVASIVQLVNLQWISSGVHFVGVPMTVYWLAAYAPRWAARAGIITAIFGAIALGASLLTQAQNYSEFMSILFVSVLLAGLSILICAVAWSLGDLARSRQNHRQALAEYTAYLEAEARNARALAAADERQHIAREMHDIVAHSLSVIITQADGARYAAAAQPEVAVETLDTIAETGRDALSDMRKLLGILRAPGQAEGRPQPQMSDIVELVEAMEVSGLTIKAETSGEARDVFNPVTQLAIYRAVQEGLTNALKHGDASEPVVLSFAWQNRGLQIQIANQRANQGASARPASALSHTGAGQGLVGIEERVRLVGGTINAAPHPDGRFILTVFIPYPQK
ncbi:sensor histidine kinase [Micrococcoides hystricis]|uniref:histidine kinase n=1 Tax=Micrococcoides hystricis TaxID=1572761 RepID=A0ABV6PC05_9MICC